MLGDVDSSLRRMSRMAPFLAMFLAAAHAFGAGVTDIAVRDMPEHEVRFTSGKTIYVEGLVGDQWMVRHRASNGRVPFSYWRSHNSPAFFIEVKDHPEAVSATAVSTGWQWVAATEAPKTERGARHFVVELANAKHRMTVKAHTLLDGTPVLVRWLEITNISDKPVALTKVSPWCGRLWPTVRPFTLGYQTKDIPGLEGWFEWKPLAAGITVVESDKGNGQDDPFFIVRNEAVGEYFIGHLAWSANWRMEFSLQQDPSKPQAGLSAKVGPAAKSALRVMAPGETIRTPALHLGHVEGDLDATVQAMHAHLRRSVLLPHGKPQRAYLIQYNVPGDQTYYTGGAFNEANLIKTIDVAAAIGAELVLLDCPWYDVYGHWVHSPTRFPRGLKPLIQHAHEKGLLFGLQTEAEGGRGNWGQSKIAKEHPEYFGKQNVLYLDRPEVAAYMESELIRVFDRYQPDLYRHEYIPGFTHEGLEVSRHGFTENNYWRYYDSLYAICDRIHRKYPNMVLQMCANGGTREDLGMASRFHESYTNEGELGRVLRSFSGKTLALPPELLVIGHGARPEQGYFNADLRASFTLSTPQLLTGAAPSLDELSPQRRERYLHYAKLYKNFIRPLLPTCKVYHHAPVSSRGGVTAIPWFAMEYAAADRSKGWATIVRLDGPSRSDTYLFKPRGLSPARTYKVTFDSVGETATIDGVQLIRDGLPIRRETAMGSELLLFETQ